MYLSPLEMQITREKLDREFIALTTARTPMDILRVLKAEHSPLLDRWLISSDPEFAEWVRTWVLRLNSKYGETLVKANTAYRHAVWGAAGAEGEGTERKLFAAWIRANALNYAQICFAFLDGKDHIRPIWRVVERHFGFRLYKPFEAKSGSDQVKLVQNPKEIPSV